MLSRRIIGFYLKGSGSSPVVVMTLDRAWLDDPARAYPVRVDPTTTDFNAGSDDTYVMSNASANKSAGTEVKVGTYDGGGHVGAAYSHFDGLSSIANQRVLGATFNLWEHWA